MEAPCAREDGERKALAFPEKDNKMYSEYHFNFGARVSP